MKHIFGFLTCIMFFSFSHLAQAQTKIGHVNMQELIQSLPDYKAAEGKLQAYAKDLQATYAAMQDEYQEKVSKYLKDSTNMTQPMKDARRQDIEDLAKRMQSIESTSDQKLQEKQLELLKPMQEKVATAVKTAAKDNGYTYVFDTSQGSALVYYPEGEDLTEIVKKKIGGTAGTPSPAPKAPVAPKK